MNYCVAIWIRRLRVAFGAWRDKINPYKRLRAIEMRLWELEQNLPYETGSKGMWIPKIMSLEETLQYVIDKHCSVARFGDGEFELVAGGRMSFELANAEMQKRLTEILERPVPNCLLCIPNVFGSLAHYTPEDRVFWRRAALWMRPLLIGHLSSDYKGESHKAVLGDPQISRAYLGVADKSVAPRVFALWKELFADRDVLVVEGRFTRLGVGNDLLSGAKSVKRIWCPPLGAFAKYGEILAAVEANANKDTLILIALGATATILAYDLAKKGYWAVDTGHLDVEYMWMKMGAKKRVPIKGRYVNECSVAGREMKTVVGEETANNVVAMIGV